MVKPLSGRRPLVWRLCFGPAAGAQRRLGRLALLPDSGD